LSSLSSSSSSSSSFFPPPSSSRPLFGMFSNHWCCGLDIVRRYFLHLTASCIDLHRLAILHDPGIGSHRWISIGDRSWRQNTGGGQFTDAWVILSWTWIVIFVVVHVLWHAVTMAKELNRGISHGTPVYTL
jgi:hypothetical protein